MRRLTYQNFDLHIARGKDNGGYQVRVLYSPAGEELGSFAYPFSDPDLDVFFQQLGRSQVSTKPEVSSKKLDIQSFGSLLFDAVFSKKVLLCLSNSLVIVREKGDGLRLRIRLDEVPELGELPWEYLYDTVHGEFLCNNRDTPVIRYLSLHEPLQNLGVSPPLRVLVGIASPKDAPPLNTDREWENLKTALKELEEQGIIELDLIKNITYASLQGKLREKNYHVFHFIGHGSFDENNQVAALIFEDEEGFKNNLSGILFGNLLSGDRNLRMVILNACEGGRASRKDPFGGIAQSLVKRNIPAIVAMQFPIIDRAAISFSKNFYSALTNNYPVDAAVTEARMALLGEGFTPDWGVPVLYLRSQDSQLFDLRKWVAEDAKNTRLATQGVNILSLLISDTKIPHPGEKTLEDIKIALDQIDRITYYKTLHDHFQNLEKEFNPIEIAEVTPDTDINTWLPIEIHSMKIDELMKEILETANRKPENLPLPDWLERLRLIDTHLTDSVANKKAMVLKSVIEMMVAVFASIPFRLNSQLVETAGNLRLEAIISAMQDIQGSFKIQDLTLETLSRLKTIGTSPESIVDELQQGTESMQILSQRFPPLVSDHNNWQSFDNKLRAGGASIKENPLNFQLFHWPEMKTLGGSLYKEKDDNWASLLRRLADNIDELLEKQTQDSYPEIAVKLQGIQAITDMRFQAVDKELLSLCGKLKQVGESLNQLLQNLLRRIYE